MRLLCLVVFGIWLRGCIITAVRSLWNWGAYMISTFLLVSGGVHIVQSLESWGRDITYYRILGITAISAGLIGMLCASSLKRR